jgi:RNA polymerase sigma-70 factor (ECF subfamily)
MALRDTLDDVTAARAGDATARNRLLERLRPRLVTWAAGHLGAALRGQVEAEDVAQEVLIAVDRDLDRFEGRCPRSFGAWLFTVARNRVRDLADWVGAEKRRLPEPAVRSQTSPSEAERRREEVAAMRAALALLPEAERAVIVLYRIEERSVEELALLWRISPNAVRIRYCRALKALRRAMGQDVGAAAATPRPPERP